MTGRRATITILYRALLDVSRMRDEVRGLGPDLADATTFQSRLDDAEQTALRLLLQAETGTRITGH